MDNDTEAHRRWRRRAITVIGLGIAMVVTLAAPALGHPVFSNDQPGFPNPNGGTGAAKQTPPYAPGSRPTLNMFTPFEQEGVIVNGAENTTVDVKVQVPTDWTSPACGAVSTSVGNRQVGTVVPGWTCTIETVSGHQVLRWTGPQIGPPPQTFADGAQFFTFQVTMPSPATNTSYGALGGPEGVFVEQRYADGFTSLWKSPNDTTRPTSVGGGHNGASAQYTIANGLIRTVAGTPPPPPPAPGAAPPGAKSPAAAPPGAAPPGAKSTGATPTGPSPTPKQGGGGPALPTAEEPPPTGPPTEASPPSGEAQGSSTPTPTEPSPGVDPQAVEQLNQQRDDATGQGFRWQVLVGVLLAAVVVAGVVIAVVKRRRRPS